MSIQITDFQHIDVRIPYTSGVGTTKQQEPQERSILEELINEPSVDSLVLKAVYHAITSSANPDTKRYEFVETWKNRCSSKLNSVVTEFLDQVGVVEFPKSVENTGNVLENSVRAAKLEMERAIEEQHQDYKAHDCIKVVALERMLSLIIAKEILPANFFLIFYYACSDSCTLPNFKSNILNAIYDLHLFGYNPSIEIRFLSFR